MAPAAAASLAGSWSGSGAVKTSAGKGENVRCRVSYARLAPKIFSVNARCATPSIALRQTGELLMVRPNVYVGDFYNSEFNIRGRIRVVVKGRRQAVTLSSDSGKGRLSLRKR